MSSSISDAAVRDATGRAWDDWFHRLGAAEAGSEAADDEGVLSHQELVAFLKTEHPALSGWWRQMITNEYEKHTGRRVTGETQDAGFQLGAQKTVTAPPARVWAAVTAPGGLAAWLGEDLGLTLEEGADYGPDDGPSGQVRVVVPENRVRLTWQPGAWPRPSTLQLRLTPKDGGRTTVSIHHEHLPDAAARDAMRLRWKAVLDELAGTLGA